MAVSSNAQKPAQSLARDLKNEGNIKQAKEQNTHLLTDPKEMDIYELPDKE